MAGSFPLDAVLQIGNKGGDPFTFAFKSKISQLAFQVDNAPQGAHPEKLAQGVFMDIVTLINNGLAQAAAVWVQTTGLPGDTFLPAFFGSSILAVLSF